MPPHAPQGATVLAAPFLCGYACFGRSSHRMPRRRCDPPRTPQAVARTMPAVRTDPTQTGQRQNLSPDSRAATRQYENRRRVNHVTVSDFIIVPGAAFEYIKLY